MLDQQLGDLAKNKVTEILEDNFKKDPINWNDFNYPPFLKLIHFSIEDTPDQELKATSKLLQRCFVFWCILWPAN